MRKDARGVTRRGKKASFNGFPDISCTPNLTGEKHIISNIVDQTHIQLTRKRRKNIFFQNLSSSVLPRDPHAFTFFFPSPPISSLPSFVLHSPLTTGKLCGGERRPKCDSTYLLQTDVIKIIWRPHSLHHPAKWSVHAHRQKGRLGHILEQSQRALVGKPRTVKRQLRFQHVAIKSLEWHLGVLLATVH